jgi:hypothetical protein
MMLTKTRSILSRTRIVNGRVFFAQDEEPFTALVSLSEEAWDDMGRPETITVSVEPGDHLN